MPSDAHLTSPQFASGGYPALLTPEEEFGLVGPQPHPQTMGYGPFPPKTPAERGRDEHGRLAEGASLRDKKAWQKSDKFNSPAFKQHGLSDVEAQVLGDEHGYWGGQQTPEED